MPKYFFDTRHNDVHHDDDGMDLPDRHAAWEQATKMAGQVLKDIDGDLKPGKDWRLTVRDEFKQRLFGIHFGAEGPEEQ